MALSGAVRDAGAGARQRERDLHRAIVLIAVVVLLVGVVEVAICSTRTIAHRTREIGVLGATGVGRAPVVSALLVEPLITSVIGGRHRRRCSGSPRASPSWPSASRRLRGVDGRCDRRRRAGDRGERRGCPGHQRRADLARCLATADPITVLRRLTHDGNCRVGAGERSDRRPGRRRSRDVWKLHKLGDEVVRALVDADLTVSQGEFVCLMGPSGSGKSTLLNIIGGLDRPTKGTVRIDGTDTGTPHREPVRLAAARHRSASSSRATT